MAYQSFPWERGDSESFLKLAALDLPRLKGKKVLDVGCNTGFFCGFAAWQGAQKVVGIDNNAAFLEAAAQFFPNCQFRCQDWADLDSEKYDVIIFLSALHYAQDQKAMIDFLMERLEPGGVLVLELGIAPGGENAFIEVERAIDKCFFPTGKKLAEMLAPYVAKYIGSSAPQAGDPIPRYVYHIRNRLPLAILFMDAPHSGKSTISSSIFAKDIKRISGDLLFYGIRDGIQPAPPQILDIIKECSEGETINFSPIAISDEAYIKKCSEGKAINCAAVIYQICRRGLIYEICDIIQSIADNRDFILDMYVTSICRNKMRSYWEENGYFVVEASLRHARANPHADEECGREVYERYMQYLQKACLINEKEYLEANPDVAQAVRRGKIPSGVFHYWNMGRKEGRKLKPDK